ncbi:MAG: mandelate racemase/muconate lactonizing enzyme family protein [Chloroflexi bacterium]|nr:mandelate racemase/muconate lactonizing enzyme family protein [Chloroflexota bacterium]
MKITDVRARLVRAHPERTWVFVEIDTDEGITGVGEATNSGGGGAILIARAIEILRNDLPNTDFSDGLVGQDPSHIERIWQNTYRRFTALGSRGLATAALSGIDSALWDIKGKALGKPVYDLLGGPVRDTVPLYTHVGHADDPVAAAREARELVDEGFKALKTDPYAATMRSLHRRYMSGRISAEGASLGVDVMTAIREEVGPDIELMIDAHGNFDVPTAIDMCNRMNPIHLTWFEEPCQPESIDALREVREHTDVPLCVGERMYTRFDFLPVLQQRLVNYIMPDICWTGGITEIRKIASLAETYYVPVTPHDASGPFNVIAGAHVMMNTPNFYRLEMATAGMDAYNACLTEPLDIREGELHLPDRPGLGYELDLDFVESHPDPDWVALGGG